MFGRIALATFLMATALHATPQAHVGSPDIFLDANAGPYRLLVTVRPPHAIPGVADVEVLATNDEVRDVRVVPLPLTGVGAQFAPVPDEARSSSDNPRLFTGHLWLMSAGAWQVRIIVNGARGEGTLSVPVPTLPQSTLAMTPALRGILIVFMLLLGAGLVGIVSAMARESRLGAGETLDAHARRRGRVAGAIATVVVIAVVYLGNMWWTVEATAYDRYVYKPLAATPEIGADTLTLTLSDPGWIGSRRLDDFVADHGHLMHLFVMSPSLDRLWHLHPREVRSGVFVQQLPAVPGGNYELFGDLVHATGVSETVTGQFETQGIQGVALSGDDSAWSAPDISLPRRSSGAVGSEGGTRITWLRDNTPLVPRRLTTFTFRADDENGQPVKDLELYMGMPGHAVFVRRDLKVFAHVHPSGSAPMAALEIAMPSRPSHEVHQSTPPPTVTFPYGFPEAGQYRIFVQVKRGGAIVTAAFDADVK